MEDAIFTFDVKSMQNSINTIAESMVGLKNTIESMTTSAGKKVRTGVDGVTERTKTKTKEIGNSLKTSVSNFSEGSGAMISALSKKLLGLAAAYVSLQSVMKGVPEIGRTFSHVGDIIQRSLFWPLRRLLIPLLQKILDWTREHRVMFIKWGVMIANAFRAVYTIVKAIVDIVQTMMESLTRKLEAIFGKTTKTMSDILNIMMFKITVVALYILEVMKPFFETLTSWWAKLIEWIGVFVVGLSKGFQDIGPLMQSFAGSFIRVYEAFDKLLTKGGFVVSLFRTIGNLVGMILAPAIRTLALTFDVLAFTIERAVNAGQMFQAWREDDYTKMKKLYEEKEEMTKGFQERYKALEEGNWKGWANNLKDIRDTFTEPTKEVLTKKTSSSTNVNSKIDSVINVNVTSPSNAKQVGTDIGAGIAWSLKDGLRNNLGFESEGVAHK